MERIVISPGEPAGIGPDITIKIAQQDFAEELIVIADPDLLLDRAKQLGLSIKLIECDLQKPATSHQSGTLKILPLKTTTPVVPGVLDISNSDYVIRTLTFAAQLCKEKKVSALVTGPVHKKIINDANLPFTGHTEFFANYCQIARTVMLFVVDQLKVALVTTHLPLSEAPKAITAERLQAALTILHDDLKKYFRIAKPRILVCGLNPHAGEGGYLGREEIDTIEPVVRKWREEQYDIIGPLPADTIFTPHLLEKADAVLAMYHDQALPVVKYIGFDRAVNMTLGLPFIRTSVDHGTALELAGTGKANAGSLLAAIKLAGQLSK